jgi:hypothetical protein
MDVPLYPILELRVSILEEVVAHGVGIRYISQLVEHGEDVLMMLLLLLPWRAFQIRDVRLTLAGPWTIADGQQWVVESFYSADLQFVTAMDISIE